MQIRILFLLAEFLFAFGAAPCKAQSCNQLQSQTAQAKAGLQRDVRAISGLGFDQTAKGLEEWAKIGEQAQGKAHDALVAGLVSFGLQSLQAGSGAYRSLTPPKANAYISDLRRFGINSQPWFDSLRQIGYTAGKPEAVRPIKDFLDGMTHLTDAVGMLPGREKDAARTDLLEGAISFAGGFAAVSPQSGFTLAGWSFLTSLAWSETSREIVPARIDQLAHLSNQQFKALASIDQVIHRHVATISKSEKAISSLGCNSPTTVGQQMLKPVRECDSAQDIFAHYLSVYDASRQAHAEVSRQGDIVLACDRRCLADPNSQMALACENTCQVPFDAAMAAVDRADKVFYAFPYSCNSDFCIINGHTCFKNPN